MRPACHVSSVSIRVLRVLAWRGACVALLVALMAAGVFPQKKPTGDSVPLSSTARTSAPVSASATMSAGVKNPFLASASEAAGSSSSALAVMLMAAERRVGSSGSM
jgi:hypothetical protein